MSSSKLSCIFTFRCFFLVNVQNISPIWLKKMLENECISATKILLLNHNWKLKLLFNHRSWLLYLAEFRFLWFLLLQFFLSTMWGSQLLLHWNKASPTQSDLLYPTAHKLRPLKNHHQKYILSLRQCYCSRKTFSSF